MTNVLDAIYNIVESSFRNVDEVTATGNRATAVGDGLESYVKNAFANTFNEPDKMKRLLKFEKVFSYQGNSSNPPDLMLCDGDALEVKKTESIGSDLQLNSSFPKAKLFSTSSLINKRCINCESWDEKDFMYIIGHIPKKTKMISSIWFIDGSVYAAEEEVYVNLKSNLTSSLEEIPNVDFSPTKELGRVNEVDPLRITNLRIRGMWLLKPPYRVFDYVHGYSGDASFQCIGIISDVKYFSFPEESRAKLESHKQIIVSDIQVQDPNNPVQLIDGKSIYYAQ